MNVAKGWRFYSADFSIQSSDYGKENGVVTLVREPKEREKWHKLPDEVKDSRDCPDLFVSCRGLTFEEALQNANNCAEKAKHIGE